MAKARSKNPNFLTEVCRLYNHMSLVLDGKIYTIGGTTRMLLDDATKHTAITNSHLRILDFTKEIPDLTKPPSTFLTGQRVPATVPLTKFGTFLPLHNGTLTLFGGTPEYPLTWADDSSSPTTDRPLPSDMLTSLTPTANKNLTILHRKSGLAVKRTAASSANVAWDPLQESAWVFGGRYVEEGYVKGPNPKGTVVKGSQVLEEGVPGMVKYEARSGRMVQVGDAVPNALGVVAGGQLVYLGGVGAQGMLVLIGGVKVGTNELRSTQEVHVYDIATRTWFAQPTTADNGWYPDPRQNFCAVAASASDRSSHNIFLYGGHRANLTAETTSFDNVYVLTLPSFHWIMINSVGSGPQLSRLTCEKIQERYLVAVGGTQNLVDSAECKPKAPAGFSLALFDLWAFNWTNKYEMQKGTPKFRVHSMLYKYIGGGPEGGATKQTPERDFSDPQLSALFKLRPTSVSNPTSPPPSSTSTDTPNDPSDPFPTSPTSSTTSRSTTPSKATIAGAVVGSLLLLLLILLLIYYFLIFRRRRQHRRDSSADPSEKPATSSPSFLRNPFPFKLPFSKRSPHDGDSPRSTPDASRHAQPSQRHRHRQRPRPTITVLRPAPTPPPGVTELFAEVPVGYYAATSSTTTSGGKPFHPHSAADVGSHGTTTRREDLSIPTVIPVQIDSRGRYEAPDTSASASAARSSSRTGDTSSLSPLVSPVSPLTPIGVGLGLGIERTLGHPPPQQLARNLTISVDRRPPVEIGGGVRTPVVEIGGGMRTPVELSGGEGAVGS